MLVNSKPLTCLLDRIVTLKYININRINALGHLSVRALGPYLPTVH